MVLFDFNRKKQVGEGVFIVVAVSFQVTGGRSKPAASLLIPRLASPCRAQVRTWG